MSSTGTPSPSPSNVIPTIPVPPPGTNFIATIKPSLTFILVVTPIGSILVPILIMLFFLSTPALRRTHVFALNIFACTIGLLEAFLNGALEVKQILDPTTPVSSAFFLAVIATVVLSPMIIDSILLTRVLAFYPKRTSSSFTRFKVLLFPILIKCGRFTAIVLYLHRFASLSKSAGSVLVAGSLTWFRDPFIITEWTLQMIDNTYSSMFFLYKLRLFDSYGRSGWVERHPTTLKRLRGLFYIALGNFIFPIILNIAQLVFITTDRSFLVGTYVILINNYVAILGVVFATIWTTGSHWTQSKFGSTGSTWNQDSDEVFSSAPRSAGKLPRFVRLPRQTERSGADFSNSKRSGTDSSTIELENVRTNDYSSSDRYKDPLGTPS